MTVKKISRFPYDLEVETLPTYETGVGYYSEEIAEKLDVLTLKGVPNKKLIDAIARFYIIQPSGGKVNPVFPSSNGGNSDRTHTKPKYSDEAVAFFKRAIDAKVFREEQSWGKEEFKLCGVKFKLKQYIIWTEIKV